MEQRTLEVELLSAKNLKDVNFITNMSVYALVSIYSGGSRVEQVTKTFVLRDCGTDPWWNNLPMKFIVDEYLIHEGSLHLIFMLFCQRSLGDKPIGESVVPIKELFDTMADPYSTRTFAAYHVRIPSGKYKGDIVQQHQAQQQVRDVAADGWIVREEYCGIIVGGGCGGGGCESENDIF